MYVFLFPETITKVTSKIISPGTLYLTTPPRTGQVKPIKAKSSNVKNKLKKSVFKLLSLILKKTRKITKNSMIKAFSKEARIISGDLFSQNKGFVNTFIIAFGVLSTIEARLASILGGL